MLLIEGITLCGDTSTVVSPLSKLRTTSWWNIVFDGDKWLELGWSEDDIVDCYRSK